MGDNFKRYGQQKRLTENEYLSNQPCPECGHSMGDMPGSRDAVCKVCGYKDPCCE